MEPGEPDHLGERIRHARMVTGTSQAGLAGRLGTTQQTVARWEQGQPPRPRWRRGLTDFFEQAERLATQPTVDELQTMRMQAVAAFLARAKTGTALSPEEAELFRSTYAALGLAPPSKEDGPS